MSTTLLATELTNLISEAKRKNADLRAAAEKSLQELKGLPNTSEQQLAADLSRRPAFIEPFLIACATRNPRFAGSGVSCLQRLVVSKGLSRSRLNNALDAFNACTELGLDVQLKILQALPSLLQNYAEDLRGDLLASALQVCASLQSAKAQTVSGVAAATLQQLVTAVFEKVSFEDRHATDVDASAEVPGDDGAIALRPAAYDAFRVFRDLVLTAETRKTKFVDLPTLTPESSLDLLWSCIQSNERLFRSHPELISVIRSNLLPLITRPLSEQLAFPMTLRSMRILDLLLVRYFSIFYDECEVAFGLIVQNLEPDQTAPWKRPLVMEVVRNFFAVGGLVNDAYAVYDQSDNGKPIVQDILAAFVRISAEKPALIGLGQQSTLPTGRVGPEQATLEAAGGMAGVISSALGVAETSAAGVSSQWSLPRTPCLEQLDKTDGPALPETYVYTMILECLASVSDSLARVVLPLTIRSTSEGAGDSEETIENEGSTEDEMHRPQRKRTYSARYRVVPLNPAELTDESIRAKVRIVAGLVDSCWPAVLATSSTFLNAALEEHYYRSLIKAYQRFAQVAGLLRLATARDALMTTLSKSAVPPHILNAVLSDGVRSPATESPRVFSSSRGMLSVDSLVSQATSLSIDRDRRTSIEPVRPMLTTRNLLCLRALLNLAIALGPTLDSAFAVVVEALRQADLILSMVAPQMRNASVQSTKMSEPPLGLQAFSTEVAAVESAASRLLESTSEYPNGAFNVVIKSFMDLLAHVDARGPNSPDMSAPSPPRTPTLQGRKFSGLPGIGTFADLQARDYMFVIPKLGTLAELNIGRFTNHQPQDSGWIKLVDELTIIATSETRPRDARRAACDVLCKMAGQSIAEVAEDEDQPRAIVQRRALAVLLQTVDRIYDEDGDLTNTDLEIQAHVLEALRIVLEQSGDSLVAGWNKIIAIISSAFERTESEPSPPQGITETHIEWIHITSDFVSVQVGKSAFAVLQLVCSDFLAVLPVAVVPSLVELLYRFISQVEDLNVALTTVTIAWNVSDFFFRQADLQELDEFARALKDAEQRAEDLPQAASTSRSAQLIYLLQRLRDAIQGTQKEVRNAAFQTVCSIFRSHGDDISPATWDVFLRSILLKIVVSDITSDPDRSATSMDMSKPMFPKDYDMSKTIIMGTSEIIAQHLRIIEQIATLPSLWEMFLNAMETYLNTGSQALNATVYNALLRVLRQIGDHTTAWTTPVYRTVALWMRQIPCQQTDSNVAGDNQESYIAYVQTASELYRLTRCSMGTPQVKKMVDNLHHCVRSSSGPLYGADINLMSPLQSKVLALLKDIRVDLDNIPSCLISIASELAVLHHDTASSNPKRDGPTFVAVASEAVDWLGRLIVQHLNDPGIIDSGSLVKGMQSLRHLVSAKYDIPTECKGISLWRRATDTMLLLAEPIVKLTDSDNFDSFTRQSLSEELVMTAADIVSARGMKNIKDGTRIYNDQMRDIESFEKLKAVLVPRLRHHSLPDQLRQVHCRALFNSSIIHALEPSELLAADGSPLDMVNKTRRGRVKHVPFSKRERMCYVCFHELLALCSKTDALEEDKLLAQAAAPFLILRLAIPIKAYIADQPLRGRRPQPLSELEELLFCFDEIKNLELHPDALVQGTATRSSGSGRGHIPFLYPLLAQAVAVAGDRWCGTEEVLMPLQSVLEATAGFVRR